MPEIDDSQIRTRLDELKEERRRGEAMLGDMEREVAELKASLLRVSGAIRVLEELLPDEPESSNDGR